MSTAVTSLVSRTRWLPAGADPLDALGPGGFAWLHHGAGFATSGEAARLAVRLDALADDAAAVLASTEADDAVGGPGTGPIAVGALPFAPGSLATLVVPALVVGRRADGRCWMTETGPLDGHRPVTAAHDTAVANPAGDDYARFTLAVGQALARIRSGTLAKVVLARQVAVEGGSPFAVRVVLDHLRAAYPSCFTFAAGSFVGSTPELLVRREGAKVESRPMAGSVARSPVTHEDDRLLNLLASSAKDLAEHAHVVDAVTAALSPLCDEVEASAPEVVRLATVAHLASTIVGRLRHDRRPSALALAGLLHPTPAVGGLPRAAALAAIAELEGFDRGLYAGPVGWVDCRGDGEWAVALRCATLDGRRAVLTAGAGIVAGSDPAAEWAETETKLEPMLKALAAAGGRTQR